MLHELVDGLCYTGRELVPRPVVPLPWQMWHCCLTTYEAVKLRPKLSSMVGDEN